MVDSLKILLQALSFGRISKVEQRLAQRFRGKYLQGMQSLRL